MNLAVSSVDEKAGPRVCVVTPYMPSPSETFIRHHITDLPASVLLVHSWRPTVNDRVVLSLPERVVHKAWRTLSGAGQEHETTVAYCKVLRRHRARAVLAEYGPTGVKVMSACRRLNIPLIVHFHGFDASVRTVLDAYGSGYAQLFDQASSIIAVSSAMRRKLISLGAPAEKVHYNPCGADCHDFNGASPRDVPPVFLSVGRFVEKKAPHLTVAAFAEVHRFEPSARLRMLGDGPLLDECRALAQRLGVAEAVEFPGFQPPSIVQQEMRNARCLVQHSLEAANGDCEGTPVGILEAGASGLPVVSTRHGGIPDVVVEGETGFLVDERDVSQMANHMLDLARSPGLAGQMGQRARMRVLTHFSEEQSLRHLWALIEDAMTNQRDDNACLRRFSTTLQRTGLLAWTFSAAVSNVSDSLSRI
jgi:colanic acid/amylovoran biosynthesis glycosyltransferase